MPGKSSLYQSLAGPNSDEAVARAAADTALGTRIDNEGITAWATFIANTSVINASRGVSSISKSGVTWTVTLSPAMANVNYAVIATADGGGSAMVCTYQIISTTQFRINPFSSAGAGTTPDYISFVVIQ
jgi:hypothetical protein